jgi:hypothetical protein
MSEPNLAHSFFMEYVFHSAADVFPDEPFYCPVNTVLTVCHSELRHGAFAPLIMQEDRFVS